MEKKMNLPKDMMLRIQQIQALRPAAFTSETDVLLTALHLGLSEIENNTTRGEDDN